MKEVMDGMQMLRGLRNVYGVELRSGRLRIHARDSEALLKSWLEDPRESPALVGAPFTGRPLPAGLTPLRLKSLSVVYALVPGRWAAEDAFSARLPPRRLTS